MWIAKFIVSCEARDRSLDSASCKAKIVSDHKTILVLRRAKPVCPAGLRLKHFVLTAGLLQPRLHHLALLGSAKLAASGRTEALNAQITSRCEAHSNLCRVQPRLSREAKAKTPLGANSVADSASLSLTTPSAKNLCCEAREKVPSDKDLYREARDKAPLGANSEAILALLKGRDLRCRAKLAFKGKTKIVALPCEATLSGEAILASPIAKQKALKAKPMISQLK